MDYDAVVVGAGPNGLAAAITLVRAGCSVIVFEANETVGGGARTAELTLPGFKHDICSAIHPLAVGSPFFRTVPLKELGLDWIHPPVAVAHPFDDRTASVLEDSVESTAATLAEDRAAYIKLLRPLLRDWKKLRPHLLGPLQWPRHPLALTRFGCHAVRSVNSLIARFFRDEPARAVFAGLGAHSILPLERPITAGFALVLAILAHRFGWPFPRGGSQQIANGLARYLQQAGGEIVTGKRVVKLSDLPPARTIIFDVTPWQLLELAGERLSPAYRKKLARYRYGPGVFKIDWALADAIPFAADACTRAGTLHLGGTAAEISRSESLVWQGTHSESPFVILAQHSRFDRSRAPKGNHTAWAYCHVPNGSTEDMHEVMEKQVERFAPGFRDCILSRHMMTTKDLQQYNANYVGGDINGGVQDIRQLFSRPVSAFNPYSMPAKGLYLCSSSTPPGGGVHGMCGYFAARAVIRDLVLAPRCNLGTRLGGNRFGK